MSHTPSIGRRSASIGSEEETRKFLHLPDVVQKTVQDKPLYLRLQEEFERKKRVEAQEKYYRYKAEKAREMMEGQVPLNSDVARRDRSVSFELEQRAKRKEIERLREWKQRAEELRKRTEAARAVISTELSHKERSLSHRPQSARRGEINNRRESVEEVKPHMDFSSGNHSPRTRAINHIKTLAEKPVRLIKVVNKRSSGSVSSGFSTPSIPPTPTPGHHHINTFSITPHSRSRSLGSPKPPSGSPSHLSTASPRSRKLDIITHVTTQVFTDLDIIKSEEDKIRNERLRVQQEVEQLLAEEEKLRAIRVKLEESVAANRSA